MGLKNEKLRPFWLSVQHEDKQKFEQVSRFIRIIFCKMLNKCSHLPESTHTNISLKNWDPFSKSLLFLNFPREIDEFFAINFIIDFIHFFANSIRFILC